MCIFMTFIQIYIGNLNDNSKFDIKLKSPLSLNHEWNNIGTDTIDCIVVEWLESCVL